MAEHRYDRNSLIRWYDEQAATYDEATFRPAEDRYAGDLYRIELVLNVLRELRPKRVLDVGCGTAEPMLRLLTNGLDVRGFDISPGMIAEAKAKLVASGYSADLAQVDDLLDRNVASRQGGPFDAVVANGVFPYIEDDRSGHENIATLVSPGGWYVGAYSNELFDLFTLNRFSVAFQKRNFIDDLAISEEFKSELVDEIRGLLTKPDEPRSIPGGARDFVYVRAHNPLTIGAELSKFGFRQKDIMFYKFHAFPPLLRTADRAQVFNELSHAYEVARARDWRGHFLASTFIVVAQKTE
jgi:SAM-dependent methyltransferase